MSIVSWSWDGDRPGAPDIGVTQLIGQLLQLISVKMVVIPQDMIVTGT